MEENDIFKKLNKGTLAVEEWSQNLVKVSELFVETRVLKHGHIQTSDKR